MPALEKVQSPLWTIVTRLWRQQIILRSWVQIPLWTIVTIDRIIEMCGVVVGSDSSMDDCNDDMQEFYESDDDGSDSSMDDCNK